MKQPIIGSLCWVIVDDQILMLRRNKQPFKGLWVAPGGKIEIGESPVECAVREIREETGLVIESPKLRGVASVFDQAISQHWILFIYAANIAKGTLGKTTEGELAWVPQKNWIDLSMAKTDRLYLEQIFRHQNIFQVKITYDSNASMFEAVFADDAVTSAQGPQ